MKWHNSRLEFDLDDRDGLGNASFAKNLGLAKTVLVLFLSLSSRVQMKAREAQNLPFAFSVYDDGQWVQLWSFCKQFEFSYPYHHPSPRFPVLTVFSDIWAETSLSLYQGASLMFC